MFSDLYLVYLISALLLLPCLLLSVWASVSVHTTFSRYDKMMCSSGFTGSEAARRLLQAGNAGHVDVVPGAGTLTDNFNPKTMAVTLSQSTFSSASVSAVAVAAHEVGHVMQHEDGYLLLRLRAVLVPVTNIGTMLALPVVLLGILLGWLTAVTEIGNILVFIGVCLYALSTVFMLVTLPVELNASRRAKAMLAEQGIICTREEQRAAAKVLRAAAMTYVASLLVSLVYLLRFLLFVLLARRKR